jgi:hypothetical protein
LTLAGFAASAFSVSFGRTGRRFTEPNVFLAGDGLIDDDFVRAAFLEDLVWETVLTTFLATGATKAFLAVVIPAGTAIWRALADGGVFFFGNVDLDEKSFRPAGGFAGAGVRGLYLKSAFTVRVAT